MEKEKRELILDTIGKLDSLHEREDSKVVLDETSLLFNLFMKNFYGIRKEMTSDEMVDFLSRKPLKEKELLISLVSLIDLLSYNMHDPPIDKVRVLLSEMIKSIKLIEVTHLEEKK